MTIRYECPECSSVLKIKPEKAGQQGKCPKCKSEFTIPEESTPQEPQNSEPLPSEDDLIDMPLEVTPAVVLPKQSNTASDEFDPMGVLNSDSASGGVATAVGSGEMKPSVADLMREHQEKRAREEAKRLKRQQKKALNPLLAEMETSGSAADAITRTYERKREEASDAAPLSRDERRAKENRAAIIRFSLQLAGVLTLVIVFGVGLFTYVLSSSGPAVVEVTGKVTFQGQPLSGYRVQFEPIQKIGGPALEGGTSSGRTSATGDFVLQYKPNVAGAVVGLHKVTIENTSGLLLRLPPEMAEQEVTEDAEQNHFEFNL